MNAFDDEQLQRLRAFAATLPEVKTWDNDPGGTTGAVAVLDGAGAVTSTSPGLDAHPVDVVGTDRVPEGTYLGGAFPADEAAIVALWDWDTFQTEHTDWTEAKAVDTDPDPSPNRGAAQLRRYWTRGPGAAKIGWGTGGDFLRCVAQLGKYVSDPKGLCNVYHVAATGSPPGKGHKSDDQPTSEGTPMNTESKNAPGPDGVWDFDAIGLGLVAGEANTPTGDAAEYKEVGAQVIDVDRKRGIVTAIVSVTGIEDRVKDVIHPGAYKKTLVERKPKGVWSHDWDKPISKTLEAVELQPGDSRLPKTMRGPGGTSVPWPGDAGGLLVKTQFNLLGDRGKQALADVEFFADDQEWSIGYNVPPGGARVEAKSGVRHIYEVDLFEYSPVLFGAMPAAATVSTGWDVKSAQHAVKAAHMILDAETVARAARLRASVESKAWDESAVSRDDQGQFAPSRGSGYKGKGKNDEQVKKERMSVEAVQRRLVDLGILGKDSGKNGGVDGLFGPKTEAALKKFQRDNKLPETGRADEATMKALQGDKGKHAAPAPAPAPAPAADAKVPLKDRPGSNEAPDVEYEGGTGKGWDYKPPAAAVRDGKLLDDGGPRKSPAGGESVDYSNGTITYDDGSKFDKNGWQDTVASQAQVRAAQESVNASRASNNMAPLPLSEYARTGKTPLKKKGATVNAETKADDGDAVDRKAPHEFDPDDQGVCKECGLSRPGHFKAQRQSATGDEKADEVDVELKAARKCAKCGSTSFDEFEDGTVACEDCGEPYVETKAGRVLSSVNLAAVKAAYESLGRLLQSAGALDGATEGKGMPPWLKDKVKDEDEEDDTDSEEEDGDDEEDDPKKKKGRGNLAPPFTSKKDDGGNTETKALNVELDILRARRLALSAD